MRTLITYQSKTGFTKKYAEWIAKELNADLREVSDVRSADAGSYGLVIHGGWLMGGRIIGLNRIRNLHPNQLMVFAVGLTGKEQLDVAKCIETNKLGDTPFFYYEGGTDPERMGWIGRTIVRIVSKQEVVYLDHSDKGAIGELVKRASSAAAE